MAEPLAGLHGPLAARPVPDALNELFAEDRTLHDYFGREVTMSCAGCEPSKAECRDQGWRPRTTGCHPRAEAPAVSGPVETTHPQPAVIEPSGVAHVALTPGVLLACDPDGKDPDPVGHGSFSIGSDARDAVQAAVMLEDVARTVNHASQAGQLSRLEEADTDHLYDRYQSVYRLDGEINDE